MYENKTVGLTIRPCQIQVAKYMGGGYLKENWQGNKLVLMGIPQNINEFKVFKEL